MCAAVSVLQRETDSEKEVGIKMKEGEKNDELLGICQSVTLTPTLTFYASPIQAPSQLQLSRLTPHAHLHITCSQTHLFMYSCTSACMPSHTYSSLHGAQFMEGKATRHRPSLLLKSAECGCSSL